MSRLETVLKHGFSWSWLSVDTFVSCLGSVLSVHVSSSLMSRDEKSHLCIHILGYKCLFCAETLAFVADSIVGHEVYLLAVYLLYKKPSYR